MSKPDKKARQQRAKAAMRRQATHLEESVLHFGGGCDCEVLANVDPQTQVDGWPRYLELYGRG